MPAINYLSPNQSFFTTNLIILQFLNKITEG